MLMNLDGYCMTDIDDETKHNLEILKALNEAIEKGPWDQSNFFKAIGKKLVEIRNRFRNDLNLGVIEETGMSASVANRIAQRHGLIEVFILLYNADGSNIGKWESTINSVRAQIMNRPVYRDEALAKAALRGAINKQNEGYIAAYVRSEDILQFSPEKIPRDRWNNELLTIHESGVMLSNITRFIHLSGNYEVENGKLIRQSSIDFL